MYPNGYRGFKSLPLRLSGLNLRRFDFARESLSSGLCYTNCYTANLTNLLKGIGKNVVYVSVVVHRDLHGRMPHEPMKDRGVSFSKGLSDPAPYPFRSRYIDSRTPARLATAQTWDETDALVKGFPAGVRSGKTSSVSPCNPSRIGRSSEWIGTHWSSLLLANFAGRMIRPATRST